MSASESVFITQNQCTTHPRQSDSPPFPFAIELQRRRHGVRHRPQLLGPTRLLTKSALGLTNPSVRTLFSLVNASWIPLLCLAVSALNRSIIDTAATRPTAYRLASGICLHLARPDRPTTHTHTRTHHPLPTTTRPATCYGLPHCPSRPSSAVRGDETVRTQVTRHQSFSRQNTFSSTVRQTSEDRPDDITLRLVIPNTHCAFRGALLRNKSSRLASSERSLCFRPSRTHSVATFRFFSPRMTHLHQSSVTIPPRPRLPSRYVRSPSRLLSLGPNPAPPHSLPSPSPSPQPQPSLSTELHPGPAPKSLLSQPSIA